MFPIPEPITGRKLRFALIGCGRIAAKHMDALEEHGERCELVAVCDPNEKARSAAAQRTDATAYDRLDELLRKESLDAVVLATPSGLHAEQTILAAEAGCHVVTEKPMATRWHDGKRMVAACDQAGVYLFVVKQNRHNATIRHLKQAVDQERFGQLHMANLNVFWTRPQEYYDSDRWRGTWEFDGGALMNQASHYVDLLDWLIGPVASVQAMTGTLARKIEVEDTATVNVRWRQGTMGSMAVTMLTYPKNFEGSITLIGDTGTVRIGGVAVNEIQHWEFAEPAAEDEEILQANYEPPSVYGLGHPRYYENVIETLRGEAEPETDGREGLRSLELLIATYLSARDGKQINLPLDY